MPKVTLEQWRMLKAVVEAGGFSRAAEVVHKSPSSINHAVQKLQGQLGVPLLEIRGRKAELTRQGAALLRRANHLLEEAQAMEVLAQALAHDGKTELGLAVDQMLPVPPLVEALQLFAQRFPGVRIQLYECLLDSGQALLQNGKADLLLGSVDPALFLGEPLGQIRLQCVAHPEHALAKVSWPLNARDLRLAREVVVRDSLERTPHAVGIGANEQRWRVGSLSMALQVVEAGLAYAWLPECLVQESLACGRLVVLTLECGSVQVLPFALAMQDPDRAGAAEHALAQMLKASFASAVLATPDLPSFSPSFSLSSSLSSAPSLPLSSPADSSSSPGDLPTHG